MRALATMTRLEILDLGKADLEGFFPADEASGARRLAMHVTNLCLAFGHMRASLIGELAPCS